MEDIPNDDMFGSHSRLPSLKHPPLVKNFGKYDPSEHKKGGRKETHARYRANRNVFGWCLWVSEWLGELEACLSRLKATTTDNSSRGQRP